MKTVEQELSRVDLNLLVSLSVLLKERNVTRAAEVLYLSQPAMSRTLRRLRDLFGDPLFLRESNGLQPTEKALQLQAQIDQILFSTSKLITNFDFEPQDCEHTFKISTPPLLSRIFTAPIIRELSRLAPNCGVIEYPPTLNPKTQLKDGLVDFSIHIDQFCESKDYESTLLTTTYPVIYGHRLHPLVKSNNVTLEQCMMYQFVDLNLDVNSIPQHHILIDEYLKYSGHKRNITFKSNQLSTLIDAMNGTNKLLIASHILAISRHRSKELVPLFKIDSVESLKINFYLNEHRRTKTSNAHKWFKDIVIRTIKSAVSDNAK
ncbi:LysR family transcriptional regulator [Photobacterium gaetbulicola]|uniref:Putative LysR family transcriptional regulator n=1 Tax=Photobacterium gaetbulicola Gung47 TaxID=658445 RepID=A0A0C5W459_9GAMM|nr:LysR family transcriptional regulator [Photobacterium gaetbulicola]AJR06211.1 putative LysR family transcriptional regulator [Photobacterium gaetbulicola Gung47]PST98828.1 LysR family transcriptional regulator [Photobacterium gaetbulicola]